MWTVMWTRSCYSSLVQWLQLTVKFWLQSFNDCWAISWAMLDVRFSWTWITGKEFGCFRISIFDSWVCFCSQITVKVTARSFGYQSTRHTVISSHGHVVTRSTRHRSTRHIRISQGCSLGLDVSVSRWSRDVVSKRLGLVSVSWKRGKVSVSISSRTENQTSRSRTIGSCLQANVHSFLLHCKIAPTSFWMRGIYIVYWFTSLLIYCSTSAYQDATWYRCMPRPRRHCVRWEPPLPELMRFQLLFESVQWSTDCCHAGLTAHQRAKLRYVE